MDDTSVIRRVVFALAFGLGTWMLALINPAIGIGVAGGLLAFYVTGVETRVYRLERLR